MEASSGVSTSLPDSCILLGGQPRSGTSLLTSMLRESETLFQAFELHIRKPSFIIGNGGNYTRNIFKQLGLPPEEFDVIERLQEDAADSMNLGAWTGPKEEVSAELLTGNETLEFERELQARGVITTHLMRRVADLVGKNRWGFKILGDIIYADKYASVWPNACFILLVRDPRDHALSVMKLNAQRAARDQQFFYTDYNQVALGWKKTIGDGEEVLAKNNLRHIVVRYEDLVQKPDATLAALSHTLDLDLSRSKEFHKSDYINEHVQRFKHHDSLRQPINTDSVGKWKTEMSHAEAAVFERVAGDLMAKHGYL